MLSSHTGDHFDAVVPATPEWTSLPDAAAWSGVGGEAKAVARMAEVDMCVGGRALWSASETSSKQS